MRGPTEVVGAVDGARRCHNPGTIIRHRAVWVIQARSAGEHVMYRLILGVVGLAVLLAIGGLRLSNDHANAQETPRVGGNSFGEFARQSLQVGDVVLFQSESSSSVVVTLLTKEQVTVLSNRPRGLNTVKQVGEDYFVVGEDSPRGTFSDAFGTRTIERVVPFRAVTEFRRFVGKKEQ